MLYPLLEFQSYWFAALTVMVVVVATSSIADGDESATFALGAFLFYLAASIAFVTGFPRFASHALAIYFVGSMVWVPTYWYLVLRSNRIGLLDGKAYCGDWDNQMQAWVPSNPSRANLICQGVFWPVCMPCYITKNWVGCIVQSVSGLLNRIRIRMAVPRDQVEKSSS